MVVNSILNNTAADPALIIKCDILERLICPYQLPFSEMFVSYLWFFVLCVHLWKKVFQNAVLIVAQNDNNIIILLYFTEILAGERSDIKI